MRGAREGTVYTGHDPRLPRLSPEVRDAPTRAGPGVSTLARLLEYPFLRENQT
jgi:hypothetical protein